MLKDANPGMDDVKVRDIANEMPLLNGHIKTSEPSLGDSVIIPVFK